jgi:hypothetical protein
LRILLYIINVRHARLDERAVRAMLRKLELSSDGGDSGGRKYKPGNGGVYGGVCQESGVMRSVLCCCVWQESVAVNIFFTFNLLITFVYKLCTLN